MENITISKDQLNTLPKDAIVLLYLQLNESFQVLSEQNKTIQHQNEQLLRQIEDLNEKVAILTQQRFGKKSEKGLMQGQLSFDLEDLCVLNEAEVLVQNGIPDEPDPDTVVVRRKRKSGSRDINLSSIEVEEKIHDCSEEELAEAFPNGFHQLSDEVYKELQYIPGRFLVIEHHVRVYADNHAIIRGAHPNRLLSHSILTPELAAAIFNAKYVNAIPLNRLSEEFLRNDVNIPRQDMAGWMIRLFRYYLGPVKNMFKEELLKAHHIHCDETPFKMPEHGKQYMWVYHSPGDDSSASVYLYDYPGTRGAAAPEKYLSGYHGVLVTDGYNAYHTLAKRHPEELKVAGCWVHTKRKFAEIIKTVKKDDILTPGQKVAAEAVKRIQAIYHTDNMFKESSPEERLDNRQQSVKPLVDAYFAWVKEVLNNKKLDKSSKLNEALNYSVNQEPYLRVFLDDARIPLDNNDAERSIRTFCLGKKNWTIIDSVNGAEASAFLYSLAETAKANQLKPYEYFVHLMSELVKHPRGNVPQEVLEELMPWSESIPDSCRKLKTR